MLFVQIVIRLERIRDVRKFLLPDDAIGSMRGSEPRHEGSNPSWAANLRNHETSDSFGRVSVSCRMSEESSEMARGHSKTSAVCLGV